MVGSGVAAVVCLTATPLTPRLNDALRRIDSMPGVA
jgi:hypothetical protein